jgi:NADPH:quinone reductase-like Zn-dependent oxidoreductase
MRGMGRPRSFGLRPSLRLSLDPMSCFIKVYATTINRTDRGFRQADPVLVRFFAGLTRPRRTILGSEFAGEVEAFGQHVRSFTEGDAVFGLSGDQFGAHAEYLCVPESGSVARKPANVPTSRLPLRAMGRCWH